MLCLTKSIINTPYNMLLEIYPLSLQVSQLEGTRTKGYNELR